MPARPGGGAESDLRIALGRPDPAPREPIGAFRIGRQEVISNPAHVRDQRLVPDEVRHPHLHESGLADTEDFSGTAQFQIAPGHFEPVTGLPQCG